MSWLFSQALVAAYSEANSLDGEQFVPSSGNPIPQAYLSPDKMTDFSRLSRFGMTYKPLTENLGAAVLMWCQEDSRARTLALREKAQELTESEAGCGEKWHASFTKYDPDSRSWKTAQCLLLGDLELFSETWPQWGLMRSGECWERLTLERLTRGTESGLSPDGVTTFHTPNTTGLDGGSNSRRALRKRTATLPTVVKSDYAARRPTENWQGKSDLPSVVWTQAGGTQNPQMPPAKLSADWVEWLMGWPLGWTELKPLATDKSPCVPQEHGKS